MRIESCVTSASWIPSEAVTGRSSCPWRSGSATTTSPPPEIVDDVERLAAEGRCRFANELRAWIEVEDGRIVGYEHRGRSHVAPTRVRPGTAVPSTRPIGRPPFVRVVPPPAWTTLALTLCADGRVEHDVVGASPFPRHWIYGADGRLAAKTGTIDFRSSSQRVVLLQCSRLANIGVRPSRKSIGRRPRALY